MVCAAGIVETGNVVELTMIKKRKFPLDCKEYGALSCMALGVNKIGAELFVKPLQTAFAEA